MRACILLLAHVLSSEGQGYLVRISELSLIYYDQKLLCQKQLRYPLQVSLVKVSVPGDIMTMPMTWVMVMVLMVASGSPPHVATLMSPGVIVTLLPGSGQRQSSS